MSIDLPYAAGYAKSGRASYKGCRNPIAKETLRLAVVVQVGVEHYPSGAGSRHYILRQ
jgi:hypothetical protein